MPCRALLQALLSARGAKTTSRLKVCVWLPHKQFGTCATLACHLLHAVALATILKCHRNRGRQVLK